MLVEEVSVMKLTISGQQWRHADREIKDLVSKRLDVALESTRKLLFTEAARMTHEILGSSAWSALTGRLVGEFGFTPWEVDDLIEITRYMLPGVTKMTTLDAKIGVGNRYVILNWVDFEALSTSPFAMHELTKFNKKTKHHDVTQVVSWVDWLENGVTVRGYEFDDDITIKNSIFSRSRKGLMKATEGGMWSFEPTNIFHKTADGFNPEIMKKNLALVVRRGK